MVRVTTPEPGYNGSVGAVTFVDGAAEVEPEAHAAELAYFVARGYGVDEVAESVEDPQEDPQEDAAQMPKKSASAAAWRAWAVEHGGLLAEEAEEFTRDQLVERFTVTEETPS